MSEGGSDIRQEDALSDNGLRAPTRQRDALSAIPAQDMLVDPAELEVVLEEPAVHGVVSRTAMAAWTIASLAVTIMAAIWWAAAGH